MNKRPLAAALLLALPMAHASEILAPIVVTASGAEFKDTEAPYATEVHTREAIENSGVSSLYDYLDRHTSVTTLPSLGNPFSQALDMRGYGIGDGYQNIVVTVDGRRLNNIDMSPQLLGAIPLSSIERIEIVKGSGSVMHGDGATAGVINIHTRDLDGAALVVAGGSHGLATSSVSAGVSGDYAALSVMAENFRRDGFRDPDVAGVPDQSNSNNIGARLRVFPTDAAELRLSKTRSWIDTVYGSSLTQAQFDANPSQNGGKTYTQQIFISDATSAGMTVDLGAHLRLGFDHHREDKSSEWVNWSSLSDYKYRSNDLALNYENGPWKLIAGAQQFNGTRSSSWDDTKKKNLGTYLQGHYIANRTSYSIGARQERVTYTHTPTTGTPLEDSHDLAAYDFGVNQRLGDSLSLFVNYSDAFQAPDIDRFFYYGVFNDFIEPARARTWNLGLNHVTNTNKLKVGLFHVSLENEIYSTGDAATNYNSNIDKSHKYGLELQNSYRVSTRFNAALNYTYTRAIIDEEDAGGGAFDGKDLPGVSPHTVNARINFLPTVNGRLTLSHTWRSEAYAANDFANTLSQKQAPYNSTDLGYSHRFDRLELFAKVDNLLEESNGLWIDDDAIYPVNFERTWRAGIRADF